MSLFRVSMLTSPARVCRESQCSPTPFVTLTGFAMSATVISPFSFRDRQPRPSSEPPRPRSMLIRESPVAHTSRMDFVSRRHSARFRRQRARQLAGRRSRSRPWRFFAGNSNLRVVRRTHANVAAAVAYRNARIRGNGFGAATLQVEVKTVSTTHESDRGYFPCRSQRQRLCQED